MTGELSKSLKAAAEEARREARSVRGTKQDDSVTQSELLETVGRGGFGVVKTCAAYVADTGRTWWLWTCLAGFGLGVIGWDYCRRRRNRRHQRHQRAASR